LVLNIFSGEPFYHLWYLYMIPGLYAVAPFLSRLISRSPRRRLWFLASAVLCVNCAYAFSGIDLVHMPFGFLINWVNYLGYFMLGHLFYTSERRLSPALLFVGYLTSMAIAAAGTVSFFPSVTSSYFFNYNSLPVTFGAVCFFLLFCRWKLSAPNVMSRLARYSLGVYLIHAFIVDAFVRLDLVPANAVIGMLLLFGAGFGGSLLLTFVLKKIKYTRRIV
jgi:surface polysaccharide O-acyltransferase-like enzyme